MCFSAKVSFTAGVVLTAVGIATTFKSKRKDQLLIALIPLLFAAQQFAEGVIWLFMNEEFLKTPLSNFALNAYLLFAWAIWPIYFPLAFFLPEKVTWKRILMGACFFIGCYIAFADLRFLFMEEINPKVVENSIFYGVNPAYKTFSYVIVTILPPLVSSLKGIPQFGLLLIASFIVSQTIFSYTMTSVWCFFAALLSFYLYFIFNQRK